MFEVDVFFDNNFFNGEADWKINPYYVKYMRKFFGG